MIKKKKIVFLFPHAPNPRMIKRIDVLKEDYLIDVIYWNRGVSSDKDNDIPKHIDTKVITHKTKDGNPLKRLGTTLKVVFEALKYIKQFKPDYVYISKTDMLLVGQMYRMFHNRNVKIIYEVSDLHSLMIDNSSNLLVKFATGIINFTEKRLCKNVQLLVVTSEYFYTHYYKRIIDENKVLFIPNTPDPQTFKGIKRVERAIPTIGFIGVIRYAEQIELLIDAAQESKVNVLIAGNGADYERIKQYSVDKDFVELYGEYNYEKEIKSLYEKIDVVYSVYNVKMKNVKIALPNRLYEAIYTETPIIAAKDTYLGEIVSQQNIGKIIQYDSCEELVEVLTCFKKDIDNVKHFKKNMLDLQSKWQLSYFNEKLIKGIKKI